jgi:hypothetical protein
MQVAPEIKPSANVVPLLCLSTVNIKIFAELESNADIT